MRSSSVRRSLREQLGRSRAASTGLGCENPLTRQNMARSSAALPAQRLRGARPAPMIVSARQQQIRRGYLWAVAHIAALHLRSYFCWQQ